MAGKHKRNISVKQRTFKDTRERENQTSRRKEN